MFLRFILLLQVRREIADTLEMMVVTVQMDIMVFQVNLVLEDKMVKMGRLALRAILETPAILDLQVS